MNYFRQLIFEMRHQKVMVWVSVSGTALAIFLIMVFFMADNVRTVAISPESNRSRILLGCNIHQRYTENDRDRAGSLSLAIAEKLYGNLDGIERKSYVGGYVSPVNVKGKGGESYALVSQNVDAEFWKIFDFKFLAGTPFEEADCEIDRKIAVLSRSSALRLFNTEDAVGREILIGDMPYTVIGVVEDVNPLLKSTFTQVYVPLGPFLLNWENSGLGQLAVYLVMKPGVDKTHIRAQVRQRYAQLNAESEKDNIEYVYHLSPYDAELIAFGQAEERFMTDPDLSEKKKENAIVYLLLLLLPAINLSCMTRGRLRQRVSEIGVRRAFGAKKTNIVLQFLGENMIITLLGGIIGLILSVIFMLTLSSFIFRFASISFSTSLELLYSTPTLSMLLTWETFLWAFCGCLLLNILSTTIPAWKASRIAPAAAIVKVNG